MFNQSIYIIAWEVLIQWLLPSFLRKEIQLAWLNVLISPFKELHTEFNTWTNSVRYKLQHTGQVIYLEKVLNEYFNIPNYDHQDHRNTKVIYISDGTSILPKYIYQKDEQHPLFIDGINNLYIRSVAEIEAEHINFFVNIPNGTTYNEQQLIALVNYYKLAGKNFQIKIV